MNKQLKTYTLIQSLVHMKRSILLFLFICIFTRAAFNQGYLHTEGKYMYNGLDEEVLLHGINTGNWMLQEGYMMQTGDIAGSQHELEALLIETIGKEKTDSFYNAWLAYHVTRTDVDSLKSWGYNCIRAAMHYKWFTPPIEEEPVPGEITWIDKGFVLIDSLLGWCSDNAMYLILDLHGAPGGQGTDANISDYDPSKPSLWESEDNKQKTIALWRKLAERYSDEPWIGGYDLINETNWTFSESGNAPLWELYQNITTEIREVDTNHVVIIEGNWWANDYTGVPSPWDDNMVFSFHKYWNFNEEDEIDWVLDLRNTYNVPVWLGESGENSNTWFTNLIVLCEDNHIGWTWWPVKKHHPNNPLRVEVNNEYLNLIEYWRGHVPAPTEEEAFQAVLQFAENHRFENCIIQKDIIDAVTRQPYTTSTIPYNDHLPDQAIYVTDYDLGRNNHAYFDNDTGDYHGSLGGDWINWNQGWEYRNDGVDIEKCQDTEETNGYNVGWTENNEWLAYTIVTDSAAAYKLNIRHASDGNEAIIRFMSDNKPITGEITLSETGGWQEWTTTEINNIVLPADTQLIKLYFVQGGANLNYFKLSDPVPISSIDFEAVYAETNTAGTTINLYLNKEITSSEESIHADEFSISADGNNIPILDITLDTEILGKIIFLLNEQVYYGTSITISYNGYSVQSGSDTLNAFSGLSVVNNLPVRYNIPGRIEAEDYYHNNGFELESCEDDGNGYNTGYADAGDYLDYLIHVTKEGRYTVNYRVATTAGNAEMIVFAGEEGNFAALDTVRFSSTGGWQSWNTQQGDVFLEEGRYTLRIYVKQGAHNLNWFEFSTYTGLPETAETREFYVFPNPAHDKVSVQFKETLYGNIRLSVFSSRGNLIKKIQSANTGLITINTSEWKTGIYFFTARLNGFRIASGTFTLN